MTIRSRSALQRAAIVLVIAAMAPSARAQVPIADGAAAFPAELVEWAPRRGNPVFTAESAGEWAVKIRERGWILREGGCYYLWFTGYDGTDEGIKRLGYATSSDGLRWVVSARNPLSGDRWVEDMMVVKCGDTYYMFAEGADDNHAVMLTSKDRVAWKWQGPLDIRLADGKRRADEPCGTPTVWREGRTWYLFYERLDRGVWIATTRDLDSRVWVNVRDEPVLVPGPAGYDKGLIALDQIIEYRGAYFAFYHGSADGATWNTNVARSFDLVHWEKFPGNPIIEDNRSSGVVVPVGRGFRLYTMHGQIDVFEAREK